MPHLDLDFSQKAYKLYGFAFWSILLLSAFTIFTGFIIKNRELNSIKKEATVVYTLKINPIGYIKDSNQTSLVVKINKRDMVLKGETKTTFKEIPITLRYNNSRITIYSKNFKRSIRW